MRSLKEGTCLKKLAFQAFLVVQSVFFVSKRVHSCPKNALRSLKKVSEVGKSVHTVPILFIGFPIAV